MTVAANSNVDELAGYDATQVELMEEMCILVDKNDNVIGADTKKNTHLMTNINPPRNLLHRAFSVFLFDSENRLLLQQRADEKITFPGYWTNTCCSHPLNKKDEMEESKDHIGVKRAARRKLFHELGIPESEVPLEELQFLTRIHYLAPSDGMWGEHESGCSERSGGSFFYLGSHWKLTDRNPLLVIPTVDYVFILKRNVSMDINPNEVQATRYVTKPELQALFENAEKEGLKITPWFRLIVESFLYKWWDNLDKVGGMRDEEIHRL